MAGDQDNRGRDTIVLIHGLWLTPRSWERWIERYRAAGHEVLAPAWPGMEVEVEELRRDPEPIKRLDVDRIIDHYEDIIRRLESPPIIMGHSFGGAFVQVLLDRGLGAAGVAIESAAVKGVARMPTSMLKSLSPVLSNPINAGRAVSLTPEEFQHAIAGALPEDEALAAYERYCVPASGHVVFEMGLANFLPHPATHVNFRNNDRAPLLFIVGGADRLSPPSLGLATANMHRRSTAPTDVRQYPDRCHFIIGQAGWEEVADEALAWATHAAATRPALRRA